MKLYITPHEIVEKALWYKYEYYILRDLSVDQIEKILEENEEFILSEEHGLVIGLINTIQTNNLIHRLNQHILRILADKSTEILGKLKKNMVVINKNSVEDELNKFLKNFPDIWKTTTTADYLHGYNLLVVYVKELLAKLGNLETYEKEFHNNIITYVQFTHVKKMLDRNHG